MRSLLVALLLAGSWAVPIAAESPSPKVIRGTGASSAAANEPIRWLDLGAGLAEAKKSGRPVLVDVQTDWCGWCRRMEKTTYADPDVRDYVGRTFVAVKLDAEDDENRVEYGGATPTHRQFADSFRITGYPTTLFLAADGALVTKVPGYAKPGPFLDVLRYIGEGHYKATSWDDWKRSAADRP